MLITIGLSALTIVYALLLWRGPWWIDGSHLRERDLQPADGVVITGFRTTLVALGAGAVAVFGLWYTHRNHELSQQQFSQAQDQFKLSQDQFEHTQLKDQQQVELTREGQVTDRYVEAVKLLASESVTERLGGIYSLERVMRDSKKDHATIVEVLAAFVRSSASPLTEARPSTYLPVSLRKGETYIYPHTVETDQHGNDTILSEVPPPVSEDIQAALTVLARRPEIHDDPVVNLAVSEIIDGLFFGLRLPNVRLRGARLEGALLKYANLDRADLNRAVLAKADLSGAHLCRARLRRANLVQANLSSADLRGANLVGADLSGADLSGADLRGANLVGADLTDADLLFAELDRTNFVDNPTNWVDPSDERTEDAGLGPAEGLTVESFETTFVYHSTKLPPELAADPRVTEQIEKCEEMRTRAGNAEL